MAYRLGHRFGNVLLTQCAATIFARTLKDIFVGRPSFFPALCKDLSRALDRLRDRNQARRVCSQHAHAGGRDRGRLQIPPQGLESKLDTYRDGLPRLPATPALAVAAGSIAGMFINFLSAKLWYSAMGARIPADDGTFLDSAINAAESFGLDRWVKMRLIIR
ncbi:MULTISPECIES: hypothetical protein [unclassified Caballeronia]|uniref:hypothetical protein n=1 Tax=unclassified Caballeronia TaxID=2646786 RepID=UPI002028BFE4|nr:MULTISPECIES: hypothetical protein [unclassified Caballeronia]